MICCNVTTDSGPCRRCGGTKQISVPGGHGDTDIIPCPICDPHDAWGFPLPKRKQQQLQALDAPTFVVNPMIPVVTALSTSIQAMTSIGANTTATKLAEQLLLIIQSDAFGLHTPVLAPKS